MLIEKLIDDCKKADIKKMVSAKDRCIQYSNKEPTLTFKENNREYIAKNDSRKDVLGFKIDNGLLTGNTEKKCDAAIIVEYDICYLIELKGHDIKTACDQIDATLDFFKAEYKIKKFVGRIVCSEIRTHNLRCKQYKELSKKLNKIKKELKFTIDKPLYQASNCLKEKI